MPSWWRALFGLPSDLREHREAIAQEELAKARGSRDGLLREILRHLVYPRDDKAWRALGERCKTLDKELLTVDPENAMYGISLGQAWSEAYSLAVNAGLVTDRSWKHQ